MMLLKKLSFCLAALAIMSGLAVLGGCDIVTGSGEISGFELAYSGFTRVEISTGFEAEITQAEEYFVSINIDKSLYEYLVIAQRGDTLHIGLKPNYTYTAAVREATIRLPDLNRLEVTGGSTAEVTGFSVTHAIDFELSGGSGLVLNPTQCGDAAFILSGSSSVNGDIDMNNGKFDLSGGSRLEFAGTAAGIEIDASGSGDINLEEFPTASADIELSGGSHAVIRVSDIMDVELSGGSILEYIGSPKLGRIDISGGSTLEQR